MPRNRRRRFGPGAASLSTVGSLGSLASKLHPHHSGVAALRDPSRRSTEEPMSTPRSKVMLAATSLALILSLGTTVPLDAQEGTPESGGVTFPITPDPADCQVE